MPAPASPPAYQAPKTSAPSPYARPAAPAQAMEPAAASPAAVRPESDKPVDFTAAQLEAKSTAAPAGTAREPKTDTSANTGPAAPVIPIGKAQSGADLSAFLEEALLGPADEPNATAAPEAKAGTPANNDTTAKSGAASKVDDVEQASQKPDAKNAASDDEEAGGPPDKMDDSVTIDTIEEEMAKLLNEIGGNDKK